MSVINARRIAEPVIDDLPPFAGWLYVVIVRLMPRPTNRLRITIPELARAAHMSEKSIRRYTKILESKSLVHVERDQRTGQKVADANVYSLIGPYAEVALSDEGGSGLTDLHLAVSQTEGGAVSQTGKESDSLMRDDRLKIFVPYLERFRGLTADRVQELLAQRIRLGETKTLEVLERCRKSKGKTWQYVLESLRNVSHLIHPPIPLDTPTWRGQDELTITAEMRQAWVASEEGRMWAARLLAAKNPTPPTSPSAPSKPTGQWADAWHKAYSQLEIQLDRASFDTWVRAAVFLGYSDGIFQIGVPNNYVRDMLQHRLYRDVRRVMRDVVGEPVEICFEIHKPAPTPDDEQLPLFKLLALQGEADAAEMAFYRKYWANFRGEAKEYPAPIYAQFAGGAT